MRHNIRIVHYLLRLIHCLIHPLLKIFHPIKHILILLKTIPQLISIFQDLLQVRAEHQVIHLMILNMLLDPRHLPTRFDVCVALVRAEVNVAVAPLELDDTEQPA